MNGPNTHIYTHTQTHVSLNIRDTFGELCKQFHHFANFIQGNYTKSITQHDWPLDITRDMVNMRL
jgi:hypothetical protein